MSNASPGPSGLFPPLEPPKRQASKRIQWTVLILALAACATPGALFYWFHQYYRVYEIPSTAMEPTIRLGDRIFVDMRYFRSRLPEHGEIAVIKRNEIFITKRVIALPGDTIEGRDGMVYLNGRPVSELYVEHIGTGSAPDDPFLQNFGPTTMKAGECFVLGDNRDRSLDSRHPDFGPIPLATVVGRPLYIVSSENRDRVWERIK